MRKLLRGGDQIAKMATVTEAVKESLVGSTREVPMSDQSRAAFTRNSQPDEQTGERYMTRDDFIRAVAPADEDYVSDNSN